MQPSTTTTTVTSYSEPTVGMPTLARLPSGTMVRIVTPSMSAHSASTVAKSGTTTAWRMQPSTTAATVYVPSYAGGQVKVATTDAFLT